MSNPVVTINVSEQVAPAPATLQKTGALVSQGGTSTTPGTKSLLTQPSDLTPLLTPAKAIASISQVGSTVSVTTVEPDGFATGDTVNLTIAGMVPAGYNGGFTCSITGPSSFTYQLSTSPGAATVLGTYVPSEVNSLIQRVTTFFAQGTAQSAYVLELGAGNANDGVAFLTSWIAANPNVFYSYLVPRFWDGNAAFLSLLASFESTGAKTYFFVTTTLVTYQLYAGMKCVIWLIEAPAYGVWPANALTGLSWNSGVASATTTTNHGVLPGQWFQLSGSSPAGYNGWALAQQGTTGETLVWNLATNPGAESVLGTLLQSQNASAGIGATEFSLAAIFRVTLNYAPSSTNKVTPLNYGFVYGVTPFPVPGNNSLITTLLNANGNLIGTGAAGNISGTLVLGGKTADGNPFKYWYSVDWTQINLGVNLTAALIDGANNPQNPVDYDQPGINTLTQTAVSTMGTGISNGLVLNPIKQTALDAADLATALDLDTYGGNTLVNADPFGSYVAENPNDYESGTYNGLSVDYTPLRGFESITVNVIVSSFAG